MAVGAWVLLLGLYSRQVRACGGGLAASDSALPPTGATEVSPETSIILVTGGLAIPADLHLLAEGVELPLPAIASIGQGMTASGGASFWRLLGAPLSPSTSYVLETGAGASAKVLTQFSTAASYDKGPATPATISGLRLWRARYPLDRVAAGGCVFAEVEGYSALEFTAPALPGTPAAEVVNVLSLAPKNGGGSQVLVFSGLTEIPGGLVDHAIAGDGVTLPGGGGLSAAAALWKPELAADLDYCATITSYGRNDLALGIVSSNVACAPVTSVGEASAAGSGSGGCAIAPRASSGTRAPALLALAGLIAAAIAGRRPGPRRAAINRRR